MLFCNTRRPPIQTKMHKEFNELNMASEVFPEALLAVLAAEPDVSVGDCAVASMLPCIATQTTYT